VDNDAGKGPIRLGVADDHPAIGLAVEAASVARGEASAPRDTIDRPIMLVGQARTVADALGLIEGPAAAALDVLLCDLQIERGLDGLAIIEAAAQRGIRAIAFTSHDRASLMRAVFEAGGAGFLPKAAEMPEVLDAVRAVAAGGSAFSRTALDAVRNAPKPPTDREKAVLDGIAGGLTSDEIGYRLDISGRTVESHLRRLFDRDGVVSRTELVVLATSEGWIYPETG
jgi:two-component system response regulator DevR